MSANRWVQLTVRTANQHPLPLSHPAIGGWLWPKLARAFPQASSCCLMPDHLHLSAPENAPDAARKRLRAVLSGMRRSHSPAATIAWQPVPPAEVIADRQKHGRWIRYVHLNPCRAGLVDDPLAWVYSTHRDYLGAVADPWILPEQIAPILHHGHGDFAGQLHRYITSDPSVDVEGTPLPRPAEPSRLPLVALADVVGAGLAACRAQPSDLQRPGLPRRLFLALAAHQGWRDGPLLGAICGITRQAVSAHRRRPAPPGLEAAALCLGDARLIEPFRRDVRDYLADVLPLSCHALSSPGELRPPSGPPTAPATPWCPSTTACLPHTPSAAARAPSGDDVVAPRGAAPSPKVDDPDETTRTAASHDEALPPTLRSAETFTARVVMACPWPAPLT